MSARALLALMLLAAAPEAPRTTADVTPTGLLDTSAKGQPAPTVTFLGGDDKPVTLDDFRGSPVLVNLWATWCAPCLLEMPSLDALAARDGARVKIITISQDQAGRGVVDRYWDRMRFVALEPFLDEENRFRLAVNVPALPVSILYDATGREVWRYSGPMDWDSPEAAELLAEGG